MLDTALSNAFPMYATTTCGAYERNTTNHLHSVDVIQLSNLRAICGRAPKHSFAELNARALAKPTHTCVVYKPNGKGKGKASETYLTRI